MFGFWMQRIWRRNKRDFVTEEFLVNGYSKDIKKQSNKTSEIKIVYIKEEQR